MFDMGMGEILFLAVFAFLFIGGAILSKLRNSGSSSNAHLGDEMAEREATDNVARLRQIEEYDRWSNKK